MTCQWGEQYHPRKAVDKTQATVCEKSEVYIYVHAHLESTLTTEYVDRKALHIVNVSMCLLELSRVERWCQDSRTECFL